MSSVLFETLIHHHHPKSIKPLYRLPKKILKQCHHHHHQTPLNPTMSFSCLKLKQTPYQKPVRVISTSCHSLCKMIPLKSLKVCSYQTPSLTLLLQKTLKNYLTKFVQGLAEYTQFNSYTFCKNQYSNLLRRLSNHCLYKELKT